MCGRAGVLVILLAVVIAAGAALAQDTPPVSPLQSVTVMAWLGSWQALRAPAVAAPAATGQAEGDLEQAFHVAWDRQGEALRVKITKHADAWVGRLALEFRWAATTGTLTYGDGDLPVPVPVAQAPKGQVLWSWEYGVPAWLRGDDAPRRRGGDLRHCQQPRFLRGSLPGRGVGHARGPGLAQDHGRQRRGRPSGWPPA